MSNKKTNATLFLFAILRFTRVLFSPAILLSFELICRGNTMKLQSAASHFRHDFLRMRYALMPLSKLPMNVGASTIECVPLLLNFPLWSLSKGYHNRLRGLEGDGVPPRRCSKISGIVPQKYYRDNHARLPKFTLA